MLACLHCRDKASWTKLVNWTKPTILIGSKSACQLRKTGNLHIQGFGSTTMDVCSFIIIIIVINSMALFRDPCKHVCLAVCVWEQYAGWNVVSRLMDVYLVAGLVVYQ